MQAEKLTNADNGRHVGRVDKMSVSGYKGSWLKSSAVPISCVFE